MSEMAVAMNGGLLRTLLGSCIGLALYDRKRKVGGLAHIVLPESDGKTESVGKYVDTAIPELIRQIEQSSGCKVKLTAKIAGGASMFSTTVARNIGLNNVKATEQLLHRLRIHVIARDCGGKQGRRMSLDTATGVVVIEIAGLDPVEF
jgi:chemotaxis protein CheD